MKITNKDDFFKYIRRKLGEPYLVVELTDEMLDDITDDAIKEFSTFAYDTILQKVIVFNSNGMGIYPLPKGTHAVYDCISFDGYGSSFDMNYTPDLFSEAFNNALKGSGTSVQGLMSISTFKALEDKWLSKNLNYVFNPQKNYIQVLENYYGSVLVRFAYYYEPNEKYDEIYDHRWVKDYAVALARIQQSVVLGKYSQNLVGGGAINYSDIRSQGQDELNALKEELFNKYAGPAPISVF